MATVAGTCFLRRLALVEATALLGSFTLLPCVGLTVLWWSTLGKSTTTLGWVTTLRPGTASLSMLHHDLTMKKQITNRWRPTAMPNTDIRVVARRVGVMSNNHIFPIFQGVNYRNLVTGNNII